jgi:hypothetical protein
MLLLRDCYVCISYNNIVRDLLKALLGSVLVNTFQRATVSQWTNVILSNIQRANELNG